MPYKNVVMESLEYNDDDSVTSLLYCIGPENHQAPWDQRTPIECDTAAIMRTALALADAKAGQPVQITGLKVHCAGGVALVSVSFESIHDESVEGDDEDDDDDFIHFTLMFDVRGHPLVVEELGFKSERQYESKMPEYEPFSLE
ncbi:hypothetical protein OT109_10985 [Phycisphaeraceae bacterium D3-23]